jgi:hypothetical protein
MPAICCRISSAMCWRCQTPREISVRPRQRTRILLDSFLSPDAMSLPSSIVFGVLRPYFVLLDTR